MRRRYTTLTALAVLALAPASVHAQGTSQFTGEVTDNTGGILPGVTVEASSPALIEGSRVGITDGTGRYLLVDLRPGTYTITFTLPGFSTVLVESQELPGGFTATVDAVLSVGALEETVTVSGEAPVVDVQSISQAEVLDREVLDAIPTGRNLQSTAQLIPGVKMNRPEVGLTTAAQQTYMSVHGMSTRQTTVTVDGQLVMTAGGDGGVQNYNNQLAAQEMVYETSGISAETSTGGVRISMIPREGGNTHSGQNYFGFADGAFQGDNFSQRLQDRGLNSTESIDYVYDLNVAHGGPLIRDKFWFFGSARRFSINVPVTDSYYKNEQGTAPRYMANAKYPDGTGGLRPGINDDRITSGLLRLTYQVTQNNKFSAYIDRIIKQRFHDYDARADVATASRHHGSPLYYIGAAKWTSTLSSRLLLEAGYSTNVANWSNVDQEADVPNGPGLGLRGGGVGKQTQNFDQSWPTCVATPCYPGVGGYPGLGDAGLAAQLPGSGIDGGGIHPFYANTLRRDTTNDFLDRYHWGNRLAYVERFNTNVSMSYVTGSHNVKVGFLTSWAPFRLTEQWNGSLRQRYRSGVPYQIGRANTDVDYSLFYRDVAGFVQDTWTIDRLTLNLGLRLENIVGTVEPTERLLRTRFAAPTTLPGKDNIPNWSNIAPRLGLAYDLFGDASTALKFSWGRYNSSITHSLASALATGKVTSQSLAWFDCAMITTRHGSASNRCATFDELNMISPGLGGVAYGNSGLTDWGGARQAGSVPNHGTNGDDYVQDWEVGLASADFGQGTSTPVLDPNLSRPWSALTNIGIERELLPGLSTSFNYYRRDTQSAILLVNRAISLSDYTLFQFSNPCATAGTPGSGGFGCTTNASSVPATLPVYVLNPEAQGRTPDRVYTNTNSSTGYDETYQGFESGFNARLPNGTTVFGAWTLERNVITRCDSQDDPNKLLFCDRSGTSPLTGQDVGAAYNVPWLNEFKLSGTVPLPGDFQFSATFQSYNPRELLATTSFSGDSASGLNGGGNLWGSLLALGNVGYSVPSAAIQEAGVAFTQSPFIPLMPPGSTYLDRLQQFDISIRKVFEMGGGRRLNLQADIYNMLNAGPVLEATNRYGGGLGRPRRTIQGRFLQFATHLYW